MVFRLAVLCWTLGVGGGLSPCVAQTVFLNFNTPGQYTSNFNPWDDNAGVNGGNYSFAENATDGVAGTSGVSVFTNNDMTAVYRSGWNFASSGATILVSVLVNANGQTSGNKVQLGILNQTTNGLNSNPGVAFESFRFVPLSATSWQFYEQFRTNGTTITSASLGSVSVTVGHWYKFVVALTNTSGASGVINAGCALYDYGTDGQTPGANLTTFSTVQSHPAQDIATNTVWPALRAFQNAGISAWDNFLVLTTNSPPTMTLTLSNEVVAQGSTPTFSVLADGPGTITYAWYTNGTLVGGAIGSNYTTPALGVRYTNLMAVARNANGSASNSAALTVIGATSPQVESFPASNVESTTATLGGQVLTNGGVTATVTLFYGPADGGTNASAWAQSLGLGAQNGAFSQTLTSLFPNTTYFFTVEAFNGVGSAWATPSRSFTTSNTMTPIAVTGFNRDVVIESNAVGPPYNSYAQEYNPGEGTCYYQQGLPGTTYGLPASGAFSSVIDGTMFQFQPYTTNNALVMSSETGLTAGTLTLVTPGIYNGLAILANSASASPSSTGSLTVDFADGSFFVTNYDAADWFFNPGFALQGVDRISISGGGTQGGPTDPRFYQTTIDLAGALGASNKPIIGLTFGEAPSVGATAIYAVSGLISSQTNPPFTLAVVTNEPATGVQSTGATLEGQVLSIGGYVPTITLYYGPADGGTNAASWANSIPLGVQTGSFAQAVSGLAPSTTYYFTASAVNGAGTSWAVPSQSFTTPGVSLPEVANAPATAVAATFATLNGDVLSTGGVPTTVVLYYGPTNGGTNSGGWANSIALGPQGGPFAQTVTGLSPNSTYYFTAEATNLKGASWATPSQSFTTGATNPVSTLIPMLTYHNDNTRQGVNPKETTLTLANVNTNTFGQLFNYSVDGYVYTQPLVMTNVAILGKGTHNVVFVATEHNSVYAFDAESNQGGNAAPLWQASFINPAAGITTVPSGDLGTSDIIPEVGITATPVIDPVTGTLYVEVKTKEVVGGVTSYVHRLHALDITSGAERASGIVSNSPVVIDSTNYPGVGEGSGDNDGNGHVLFNGLREHSRPALTLYNGVVYVAYASHGDNDPYHGWLFGYDTHSLAQVGVFNSTPNGSKGGFWHAGGGAAVDADGFLYLQTGNGDFNAVGASYDSTTSLSMSILKFATSNGLQLVDYFAPSNAVSLSDGDQDLGSSGPIVLPDSAGSAAHPHLVVGGGKTPPVYVANRDNLGQFGCTSCNNNIVQQFDGGPGGDRDTTPAFFNNTLYVMGQNGFISAFTLANGMFNTTPVQTPDGYANKGGASICISANGTNDAIAWAIANDGSDTPSTPCVLRAYSATDLTQELYTSDTLAGRDSAGNGVKFTLPTIVNGKVYVGAQYALTVYGTASSFVTTPVIAPNGGSFSSSITVTLSDATPGATIYYTLDGTAPSTNSLLYSFPFMLTNSAEVQAVAVKPGAANSAVASAGFVDTSAIGSGTGLLGAYWSNVTSVAFTNVAFNTPPTLTRTDLTVNFNWTNTPPPFPVSPTNFVVRWTGSVQAQFNETYTFQTYSDAGVRLWINGQLVINEWANQLPTRWSAAVPLAAQQYYNIELDYFYATQGGGVAQLFWSSPSTPRQIIPESQLYPVSNPPPAISLTSPADGARATATASVTFGASADALYNSLSQVAFYANNTFVGRLTNAPYALTLPGVGAGTYVLSAVATDGSGLSSTSSPVTITVTNGSGLPYGLTNLAATPAFFNMPGAFDGSDFGSLPQQLSGTGVFTNTPNMAPFNGLISYSPNVPLWSDGAAKIRYMAIPNGGAPYAPNEQMGFAPTGSWSFPAGTVFVKTFELQTNLTNAAALRRLETRLLVRDTNGTVYGVTYKWRPDYSDADLLTVSSNENIAITTPTGVVTQTWYYPSPADCLTCHTPVANYVLGVNTRQLNGNYTYPGSGVTDNQLRTLNRVGLFYPAIDEGSISNYEQMYAVTNQSASLVSRARSYLDANCAQCHQPGGSGPTFDARYNTPLTNQNLIYGVLSKGNLGYDNAYVIVPKDTWRSVLYDRMNTVDPSIKMPPLARNVIDSNAVNELAAWINSLPGTPAEAPPVITPPGGTFAGSVNVTLIPPDTNATLYYTLDGTLPTPGSALYTGPFDLHVSATVMANAFESGFTNSVAASARFIILTNFLFTSPGSLSNGVFQVQFSAATGQTYVLQASTDFVHWTALTTNVPASSPFYLTDPGAANFHYRFYRVVQLP